MIVRPFSIAFVLLSSLHAFAQQNQPSITCQATEQAVREVTHQLWAAFRSRDVAAWDKLVDDNYISTDDGGVRKGKQDVLAELGKPEGNIHTDTDEQPAENALAVIDWPILGLSGGKRHSQMLTKSRRFRRIIGL